MNNLKLELWQNNSWQDISKYLVFPIKWADLLDEQLDETETFIKHLPKEYLQPLTLVKLVIENTPSARFTADYVAVLQARKETNVSSITYNATTGRITEIYERFYIVASDNSIELVGIKTKDGLKTYNHELYGIELTKIMEGFIGDPITFTNTLGNDYVGAENEPIYNVTVYPVETTETGKISFSPASVTVNVINPTATFQAVVEQGYVISDYLTPGVVGVTASGNTFTVDLGSYVPSEDESVNVIFSVEQVL